MWNTLKSLKFTKYTVQSLFEITTRPDDKLYCVTVCIYTYFCTNATFFYFEIPWNSTSNNIMKRYDA